MRFKVSMINEQGNYHEETAIAKNEKDAMINVQTFNPKSNVREAKWLYK